MYLTEKEMRGQFVALAQTTQALEDNQVQIAAAMQKIKTLCVLGCGSSYSLAKSAATQFSQKTGIPAWPIAAGDLLVNFDAYRRMLVGSTLLLLSRSGSTSEVVRAAKRCKEEFGCKVLSICAKVDTPVEAIADWSLCLPWAFDEAVCQTRTVSNLYAAALGLICQVSGDETVVSSLKEVCKQAPEFCSAQEEVLTGFANKEWTKAVVLGDSGVAGILEEGALAFKEICRRDSNHYHLLDTRHGPMVQIGQDTLVIAVLSSGDRELQKAFLADLTAKTDLLLVLDCQSKDAAGVQGTRIALPECGDDNWKAIFALYCIQLVCYQHAMVRGVDPDQPEGLDAWIKL